MKREQVERGSVILDKIETIDRALTSFSNIIGTNGGVTLSTSFTAKFKTELVDWMETTKARLEKELEEI